MATDLVGDDEEVVYRSCSGMMDAEPGVTEAEAQQRHACLEQLGILAEITTELEADTWSDAAAATAALSRLVALSTRLAAAREAYASAEAQVEVEGPALTAPALGAEVEAL